MGNKCCGSRSIRTSSKEKRTLKKNEEHSLNSSSVNEHHAAPSKDVDLPSSHISEPSNSELSTRDNRIPNTQPDEGPEITADDNKTKDYKQTKDDNKTEVYKQTTDDNKTKYYKQTTNDKTEDYKQTTDDNKTEDYKQTIYDNTTKDYKQTKDDNKIEDYKQTTDDNKTKDYKKTKYDNKTKDYKQTTNDNTTKDYKQTKDDKTKDYKQTTDDNKTKDYKQAKDDNKTKDYKKTTYDNKTKDYKQTKDDNKTKDYKQTKDNNKTKDYKQTTYDKTEDYKQTKDDNITKDYKQTKDDKTKDYKQTTDDNKTKDYKQAKDDNKTKDYKKTTYDNKTKYYKQTIDDNTTKDSEQPKDYKQNTDHNTTKDSVKDDDCIVSLLESPRSLAATCKTEDVYARRARLQKVYEELIQKSQETFDTSILFGDKYQPNVTPKDQSKHLESYSELKNEDKDDNSKNEICDKRKSKDIPLSNVTSITHSEKLEEHTKQYNKDFEDTHTTKQPKDYKQNTDHNTTKDSVKDDDCIVSLLESPRSLAATCKTEDVYARRARLQKVYEELIQKSQETFDTSILFGDKYQTNVTPKDQSKHLESYSELKNEDKDDNSKYEICDKRKSKDIPLSNVTSITHSEKLEEHTKQYNKDFEDTHTTKFCCPCPGLVSLNLKLQKTTQELRHIPNIDNEITLQDIEFEDDQLESTKLDDLLRPDNTEEKPDTEKYITDNDYLSNDDDTRESVSGEESELEKLSKTDEVKSKPEQIKAWKNLAMKPSVQMNRIKLEQFLKYNRKPQLKIIERLRVEDNDIKRNTLSPINKKYKSGTLENLKKKRQISYKKRNTEKRL